MKKQFWVGPPEHGKPEDLVELWTEPGEVSAQPPKGSKQSKSVPFLLLGFDTEFKTPEEAVTAADIEAQGVVAVSGNSFSDTGKSSNGSVYGPITGTITLNVPWNGFVTATDGSIVMPAGSGLYAGYRGAQVSMSIGMKK